MIRLIYLIRYFFIFLRELTNSTIAVAKLAMAKNLTFRPGFLAVPMDVRSDLEVTFLANSITLTPGTISVHVDTHKHVVVIHAIDIGENPDAVRESIKTALEANILDFTRGPAWRRADNSQPSAN
ncbi:MAG: Na+/H+ antiporter subunit E [Phycisphaeraceae bacterium]|nr:Na+/H+ antiporter subunit E [Phycisphaeraceae bacterium]